MMPNSILNFPQQAGCAELLRCACNLLVGSGWGYALAAPHHDALYMHVEAGRADECRQWVASERRTARLICSLWKAAGQRERNDPAFLCLLVQCGWTNAGRKSGGESIRLWRNRKIAEYLKVAYTSDEHLARSLQARFRSMSFSKCLSMLRDRTGIALYRNTYRSATLKFIQQHSGEVAVAFKQVSTESADTYKKIRKVATLVDSLGKISSGGRHVSPFNGLTPVLSCLGTL